MDISFIKSKRIFIVNYYRLKNLLLPCLLQKYILRSFFTILGICLLASCSLFLVFDLFERMSLFIKEGATFLQAISYVIFKIPSIIQLMTPVSILVATLFAIGRLSLSSEITAMRACGVSLFFLARPILIVGFCISLLMFTINETIVPISAQKLDELYHLDIKKKAAKGTFSKTNFWYRKKNVFYNIGLYDSKSAALKNISIYNLDKNFRLENRIDAKQASWSGRKDIGWTMSDAIEIEVDNRGGFTTSGFKKIPLVIDEQPSDFYNMEKSSETLSYRQLSRYIEKLKLEGVSVTNYYVDLASKVSFPFVNFIVILIAFPIALIPVRSGNITLSFAIGIAIGFGYYVIHAISLSLGNAELIPITAAAWTANILLGCIGGYFMSAMEHKN